MEDRMLYPSQEIMVQQRAAARWKEWIPLISQQLRLRNLIQIMAYNVSVNEKHTHRVTDIKTKRPKAEVVKASFYYTLHLTTMSAPFYTSEKLESENPKWAEIEVGDLMYQVNTAVNGIVIRLWLHREGEQDHVITVWGVYFSGLIYLGPKPSFDPATLKSNTIIFLMHGGYFTASECLKDAHPRMRNVSVTVSAADAQPSYSVNLLLRLHTIQQAIKKQTLAAQNLREKISVGGFAVRESRENAVLRRLLNETRPKAPGRQELLRVKKEVELVRFRVSLLSHEKSRKEAELQKLEKIKSVLIESNQDRGLELMNWYQNLHKDIEHLKEWKKSFAEMREAYLYTNALISLRQKQLISELNLIYPVIQTSENKFTICGVHLPNSEDFTGNDEVTISVALGFVAHLVQMMSIFLQLPLRYPIIHFGSRSKIVDHVAEKIPDKDREFPLFSRGKDKLQFNYGVYLLNKNIAQLRWYFSFPTQDLRATLPNLTALLHLRLGSDMLEAHHRTLSGSSLDLRSSSQNISPVGSLQVGGFRRQPPGGPVRHFEKGHRTCKSMGNSELGFQIKASDTEVQSVKNFPGVTSNGTVTSLSYSLDKGLDEYEEIKKAEDILRPTEVAVTKQRKLSHVGSEPILTRNLRDKTLVKREHDAASSGDEAQKRFLQSWQAHGPAPVCSDDDYEVFQNDARERLVEADVVQENISEECTPLNSVSIENGVESNGVISEDKDVQSEENNVFLDKSNSSDMIVKESFETVGMKRLSGNEVPELEKLAGLDNMIESSMVDSVLTKRTEALARRTGSFNLVRSRHSSSLEDGLS